MARLIYTALMSLDGFVADAGGNFDWAQPGADVHGFINELFRPVGTELYGRRMYEVMSVWQSMPTDDEPPVIADFAGMWRAADKVVYSSSLEAISTPRTRLERRFDPEAVRRMKAVAERDLSVGGPTLAAHAFRAGLVDVCYLFVYPIIVGGGLSAFADGIRATLALVDERRFSDGAVFLHYRASTPQAA